jgi:hypothetical protein
MATLVSIQKGSRPTMLPSRVPDKVSIQLMYTLKLTSGIVHLKSASYFRADEHATWPTHLKASAPNHKVGEQFQQHWVEEFFVDIVTISCNLMRRNHTARVHNAKADYKTLVSVCHVSLYLVQMGTTMLLNYFKRYSKRRLLYRITTKSYLFIDVESS